MLILTGPPSLSTCPPTTTCSVRPPCLQCTPSISCPQQSCSNFIPATPLSCPSATSCPIYSSISSNLSPQAISSCSKCPMCSTSSCPQCSGSTPTLSPAITSYQACSASPTVSPNAVGKLNTNNLRLRWQQHE